MLPFPLPCPFLLSETHTNAARARAHTHTRTHTCTHDERGRQQSRPCGSTQVLHMAQERPIRNMELSLSLALPAQALRCPDSGAIPRAKARLGIYHLPCPRYPALLWFPTYDIASRRALGSNVGPTSLFWTFDFFLPARGSSNGQEVSEGRARARESMETARPGAPAR